jgi:hypothetical protein
MEKNIKITNAKTYEVRRNNEIQNNEKGNESRVKSGEIEETEGKGERKKYLTEAKESGNKVGNTEDNTGGFPKGL